MIRRFKVGYEVELHKRTLERGLLSLIGPEAAAIAGAEESEIGQLAEVEHANAAVEVDGIAALAVRADVGVDLLCDAADTERLAGALRARGALPVCEQAAECLRVERGRPRYGLDLDDTVIPQEAGLNERAVSFTKGCYVGQETVARLYYKGKPNRHLRGLRLSGAGRIRRRAAARRTAGGPRGQRVRLPQARSDRARTGAPRGRAGHRRERRRARRERAGARAAVPRELSALRPQT